MIGRCTPIFVYHINSIGHQAAARGEVAKCVDCGQMVAGRQVSEEFAISAYKSALLYHDMLKDVRFTPERRYSPTSGQSITLSASAISFGGISSPSAFAVLRLITSWNFVGCSIGKSPGLAPFNILSTKIAAFRKTSW